MSPLAERAAWLLVWALVFSLPFEKSVWIPGMGTISRVLGMLALAAIAATAARRRSLGPPNALILAAAAFVAWTGLTFFWSLAPAATWARFGTFAQLFAMLWMIWYACLRAPGRPRRLMGAYVAGAALAAVLALGRYAAGYQTNYRRYAPSGFDPNDFGLTMALAIPMALYLALGARGGAAWLYRAAVALASASILLAASRSALIAAAVAFSFAFLTWREAGWTQRISSLVLLALLVVGAWRLAPAVSRRRLATLPAELTTGTLHDRTQIWKAGLRAFKRHRLAGVGAGAYPKAVEPWLGRPALAGHEYVAHNTFLSVLVEEGTVGAGLFALLLASLALFIWALPGRERRLWSVTLAVWAVGVSTLTWEQRKPTWLIWALIMAAWSRSFEAAKEEGS